MQRLAPVGLKSPSRRRSSTNLAFGSAGVERSPLAPRVDTQRVVHDGITYITLDLSKEDHHEYYNGFTNRVLWPILHYRVDLASSRAGI